MGKTGRNAPCPCGSGKKFKKCCLNTKPREQIVIVGSREPLRGFQYDKGKMEVMGITHDGRLIETETTFSQTQYTGQSGKEKVLSRVQDKVIANEVDLLNHLSSSFDLIIAVDTNTKVIESEIISVTGIVHCVVQKTLDPDGYYVDFPWHGVILFRNCSSELHPEKFGWMTVIKESIRRFLDKPKRIAIVTDHDLDNHGLYNDKKIPIFKDFYLPDNFALIYGRSDGPRQNIMNYVVKQCDTKSREILDRIEERGYFMDGKNSIQISQIPVPML